MWEFVTVGYYQMSNISLVGPCLFVFLAEITALGSKGKQSIMKKKLLSQT